MVRQSEYGDHAEKLVLKKLKKKHKHVFAKGSKECHFRFGDIQIGKNKDTCKIIEVKGQNEDWGAKTQWDVPRRQIQISTSEYKFLKEFPHRFFVYIVYRLKYNKNPKWNKPKIAICNGKDLLKLKAQYKSIKLLTPNSYWKKSEQIYA